MITENAYAKLNISLDVTGVRDDGYHDMNMVMQTIGITDQISIELTDNAVVYAVTNVPFIPGDERNLAVKAAKLFFQEADRPSTGAVIRIRKTIPIGAGMAGGSADAAAVLRALNREFGSPFSTDDLQMLSEKIGSDVAFCVTGGTALAQGRGEKLTELPPFPDCRIVVAKPDFSISTPELFRAIDQTRVKNHPDTDGIVEAVRNGQLQEICRRMYNVFEDVPDRRLRTVADIKRTLYNAGAFGAIMTGTGSAVFGLFDPSAQLNSLRRELKKEYGFCMITEPVGKLEQMVLQG